MTRVIKRYKNRKLYDTKEKCYISLNDIAELIHQDVMVQVVEKGSGKDITNHILTQIFIEESKSGQSLISTESLFDMIRWGSKTANDYFNTVRQAVSELIPSFSEPKKGKKDEIEELKKRIDKLEKSLEKMEK
ncbi:MAG: hypothetical protein K940chlam3_00697 [Chlamydiae bacterium]|nr:hypothetical protein [Chlamydiota bacterium]